ASATYGGEDLAVAPAGRVDAELAAHALTGVVGATLRAGAVEQHALDGAGETLRVIAAGRVSVDQDRVGSRPCCLGDPTGHGGNHGNAGGHRLEQRERNALGERGQTEDVEGR